MKGLGSLALTFEADEVRLGQHEVFLLLPEQARVSVDFAMMEHVLILADV